MTDSLTSTNKQKYPARRTQESDRLAGYCNSPILRLFGTIKLIEQLHQRPLLDAGDVRTGNAKLPSDFPLCLFFVLIQAKPADDDLFFPCVEDVDVLINFVGFQLELYRIHDFARALYLPGFSEPTFLEPGLFVFCIGKDAG